MFNTVIIEKEQRLMNIIKKVISDAFPQIEIVAEFKEIKTVHKTILECRPEIVIMNTHVNNIEISKFLEKIIPFEFETIFLSKNDAFSFNAIKYNAVDYLLIPASPKEIINAVQKAVDKVMAKYVNKQMELLLTNTVSPTTNALKKIAIPTIDGYVFIRLDDIIRFESNGTYTYIFTVKNDKIVASKNIKEFEEYLPKSHFFRIHNSHLVNINRLIRYSKGRGGTIPMEDGTQIEVASRRRNQFLNLFQ
jgi:two-component system LytT family response regulator